EFELVLGNRQLLSGFFVVALLFGVAFAMGYIVGRNSAPSPKLQAEASAPAVRDSRPQAAAPAAPPPPAEQSPAQPADTPAQPTPQPAREGPAAAPVEAPPVATVAEPAPGTYWQVIAIPQAQAEILANALKDKGLPVSLTPGTKNLTRVLVGPYA